MSTARVKTRREEADTRQGVREQTDPPAKACSKHYAL